MIFRKDVTFKLDPDGLEIYYDFFQMEMQFEMEELPRERTMCVDNMRKTEIGNPLKNIT